MQYRVATPTCGCKNLLSQTRPTGASSFTPDHIKNRRGFQNLLSYSVNSHLGSTFPAIFWGRNPYKSHQTNFTASSHTCIYRMDRLSQTRLIPKSPEGENNIQLFQQHQKMVLSVLYIILNKSTFVPNRICYLFAIKELRMNLQGIRYAILQIKRRGEFKKAPDPPKDCFFQAVSPCRWCLASVPAAGSLKYYIL